MQNSGDDDEMEPVSSDEPASSDGERAAAGLLLHRGRNISEVVQELSDAAVRHGLSGGLPELARSLGRVVEQEGTALMLQRAAIVAGLRQMEQQQRHNDDPTVLEELALPHVLKQHMLYSTRWAGGRGCCVSRGCGATDLHLSAERSHFAMDARQRATLKVEQLLENSYSSGATVAHTATYLDGPARSETLSRRVALQHMLRTLVSLVEHGCMG